ncbi:MAG: polyprenyl synthetase family protein [Microthrixaceae bacterium]
MDLHELSELLALPSLVADLDALEDAMVEVLRRAETLDALVEPGIRVVTGGGKRLRPTLTIAAAAVGGAPANDHVTAAGVAVELVQVGSLVHDDLMDHALTRRGVDTVNAREGLNWAILVGDYLLAVAGIEAASVSAAVATSLARTIADLAAGQGREVTRQRDAHRTVADYEASIRGKTAALMRCSAKVGAQAAGMPPDEVDALAAYGEGFGMAFQIVDDVLDVVASSERLGKPAGNDIGEGVFTLPVIYALDGPDGDRLGELLADSTNEESARAATELVRASQGVPMALESAREWNRRAADLLAGFDSPTAAGLAELPARYVGWALDRAGYRPR